MPNPETIIENTACERILLELGVTSLKLNVSGNSGWPDRQFFLPGGSPLFIEFKQPGEPLSPRQRYIHKFLKNHGYKVLTCDNADAAVEAVRKALPRNHSSAPMGA